MNKKIIGMKLTIQSIMLQVENPINDYEIILRGITCNSEYKCR